MTSGGPDSRGFKLPLQNGSVQIVGRPAETVLIIDDDEAKRHAVAKILRKAGYLIREGETGADALRLAAAKPALIILDVKLPDVSGFEVCQRIKEDPATAAIPVLHISTTFVDIEDRIHGLEGGADGDLTDVLEPLELVATVKALLRPQKAEEAAQISTKQWQVTFDAINDGVVLLDRNGRVVQVNSAMEGMLGKSWNDLSGQEIHNLLSIPPVPEDSPFLRMLDTGQREAVDLTLGDRWLVSPSIPFATRTATSTGASVSRPTSPTAGDWRRSCGGAPRSWRRPTGARMSSWRCSPTNSAIPSPQSPTPSRPSVWPGATLRRRGGAQYRRRRIGHMARLLDDLLDVSRFTRGKVHLRKVPVDLTTILRQAVETSRPLIEKSGHELLTSFPAETVWLDGDPTRLAQIVANLLNNAAKYTDRGGRIALVADREGNEAVVRVRDNGIGLSARCSLASSTFLPRPIDRWTAPRGAWVSA